MLVWIAIGLGVFLLSFPVMFRQMAKASGWKKLVSDYRTDLNGKSIKGKRLRMRTATFNGIPYQTVLRPVAIKQGLLLRFIQPLPSSHPSIVIPWRAFKTVRKIQQGGRTNYIISIGDPVITTMELTHTDFKELETHFRVKPKFLRDA